MLASMTESEWNDLVVGEVMGELPTGTVTLLLADVEGSTRLWQTQPDQMTAAVATLDTTLADLLAVHGGVRPVEQGEGDSFVAAFARASDAPGRGFHWGGEAHHPSLPRGQRVEIGTVGTLEEILFGPSRVADGTMNIVGALRRAMATTGYTELKEFQRIEVVVQ